MFGFLTNFGWFFILSITTPLIYSLIYIIPKHFKHLYLFVQLLFSTNTKISFECFNKECETKSIFMLLCLFLIIVIWILSYYIYNFVCVSMEKIHRDYPNLKPTRHFPSRLLSHINFTLLNCTFNFNSILVIFVVSFQSLSSQSHVFLILWVIDVLLQFWETEKIWRLDEKIVQHQSHFKYHVFKSDTSFSCEMDEKKIKKNDILIIKAKQPIPVPRARILLQSSSSSSNVNNNNPHISFDITCELNDSSDHIYKSFYTDQIVYQGYIALCDCKIQVLETFQNINEISQRNIYELNRSSFFRRLISVSSMNSILLSFLLATISIIYNIDLVFVIGISEIRLVHIVLEFVTYFILFNHFNNNGVIFCGKLINLLILNTYGCKFQQVQDIFQDSLSIPLNLKNSMSDKQKNTIRFFDFNTISKLNKHVYLIMDLDTSFSYQGSGVYFIFRSPINLNQTDICKFLYAVNSSFCLNHEIYALTNEEVIMMKCFLMNNIFERKKLSNEPRIMNKLIRCHVPFHEKISIEPAVMDCISYPFSADWYGRHACVLNITDRKIYYIVQFYSNYLRHLFEPGSILWKPSHPGQCIVVACFPVSLDGNNQKDMTQAYCIQRHLTWIRESYIPEVAKKDRKLSTIQLYPLFEFYTNDNMKPGTREGMDKLKQQNNLHLIMCSNNSIFKNEYILGMKLGFESHNNNNNKCSIVDSTNLLSKQQQKTDSLDQNNTTVNSHKMLALQSNRSAYEKNLHFFILGKWVLYWNDIYLGQEDNFEKLMALVKKHEEQITSKQCYYYCIQVGNWNAEFSFRVDEDLSSSSDFGDNHIIKNNKKTYQQVMGEMTIHMDTLFRDKYCCFGNCYSFHKQKIIQSLQNYDPSAIVLFYGSKPSDVHNSKIAHYTFAQNESQNDEFKSLSSCTVNNLLGTFNYLYRMRSHRFKILYWVFYNLQLSNVTIVPWLIVTFSFADITKINPTFENLWQPLLVLFFSQTVSIAFFYKTILQFIRRKFFPTSSSSSSGNSTNGDDQDDLQSMMATKPIEYDEISSIKSSDGNNNNRYSRNNNNKNNNSEIYLDPDLLRELKNNNNNNNVIINNEKNDSSSLIACKNEKEDDQAISFNYMTESFALFKKSINTMLVVYFCGIVSKYIFNFNFNLIMFFIVWNMFTMIRF
jgi:hypothetical protein